MKAIVLAEKPSVARDYARVLNCHKKANGYFEGPNHIVTWALGHLVTLAEPHHYDPKYKEWRIEDLPMMPEKMKLKVIGKTSPQFRTITNLMKRNDVGEFIIATDAGREGELVARWIMKLGAWRNKPFKRLWISSQTDAAIKDGFKNLKPGNNYNNLFQAAVCRAEADWLIGLNVTRALTCKFNAQLTAGRVQTPTLAMIINRENEIKNFKPKDFWMIEADFGDYKGTWRTKDGNNKFYDRAKAEEMIKKLNGHFGIIMNVNVESKADPPPLAYDLTELQRDANNRYNFSAKKTLSITQSLYESHKLVTYPRTDSRHITSDMVGTIPQRLKAMAVGPYSAMAQKLLKEPLNPGKRLVDDKKVSDHHAIIPTEQSLKIADLTEDERKIYDLIARRFITVLSPPFRYEQTTIVTVVSGERFYTKGRVVKDLGWKKISQPFEEKDEQDKELGGQSLKHLQKGAKKNVKKLNLIQDKTTPPARYTEATLLSAMESPGKFIDDASLRESIKQGGLGTPATRADIIEKLVGNYYVERQGRSMVPTSTGFQLIELVPEALRSPELTAQWEMRLSNIAQGNEKTWDFMKGIRESAQALVDSVKVDTSTFKLDNLTKTPCPMCGKKMMQVKEKGRNVLVCQDRRCGYRKDDGKPDDGSFRKSSKRDRIQNQRLINKFTDSKKKVSTSFGDLLESALNKKD